MVNDPIGDFINRLMNASRAKLERVEVSHSKHIHAIADTLKEEGYVGDISVTELDNNKKRLSVEILYKENRVPKLVGVQRVSKPSRRLYAGFTKIPRVKYGQGSFILSTPKGIMSDKNAHQQKLGGELLFKIW